MLIKNFSFWYPHQEIPTIENININIKENESVALVGPNGSGKTTLAYCLCGIIPHLIKGKMDGDILVGSRNTRDYPIRDIIKDIGIIFQNPDSQFVSLRVKDEILFGLENIDISDNEIYSRFDNVVQKFDLSNLLDKSPQDLSMGQKQKVALASVIAMKPNTLLLDEPASTLDPMGRRWFIEAVNELKGHLTIIMLSHNFDYIRKIADRVIVINDRTVKFDGSLDLLTQKDVLWLFGLNEDHLNSLATPTTKPIIRVENLSYKYPGSGMMSLDDVSLEVYKGEILGIVGPNGSGKSTLLYLMQGLKTPKRGRILIEEKDVSGMAFSELASKQSILFQNPNNQIFSSSVDEELRFGLKNIGLDENEISRRINLYRIFSISMICQEILTH